MHDNHLATIDLDQLATVTGAGKLANAGYGALVAATIAYGDPSGRLHDDPSAGPFHAVQPITTSQAR